MIEWQLLCKTGVTFTFGPWIPSPGGPIGPAGPGLPILPCKQMFKLITSLVNERNFNLENDHITMYYLIYCPWIHLCFY